MGTTGGKNEARGKDAPYPSEGPWEPTLEKMEEVLMSSNLQAYWQKNLKLMAVLLSIWAVVSYGCSILFVEALNAIKIGGFPLGFWFAQQGSIYVFVALIFIYYVKMQKIDAEHDVHE